MKRFVSALTKINKSVSTKDNYLELNILPVSVLYKKNIISFTLIKFFSLHILYLITKKHRFIVYDI